MFYKTTREFLPMIVESEKSIPILLRPLGQRMVTVVSRLDEPLLTTTLPVMEQISNEQRVKVTGCFIYPTFVIDSLSATIIANCNLKRAYQILDYVRVVNLPDYDTDRPQWPLQFYDDKMTDPEKQIVWEILRCYQPEPR